VAEPLPLFAYGTLADPRVREELLGRRSELEVVRARLHDYRRLAVMDYPYPFVEPATGERVEGMAILGLRDDDYTILDEYEDVPEGIYERVRVEVELLGHGAPRVVAAWVYARPRCPSSP
jgi:gamma-glutamylcyclotransferase (GGCT)/AIG2-like uncharacterized protein YtfP